MRANARRVENDAHHLVAFAPTLNGCTDVLQQRAMDWLPPVAPAAPPAPAPFARSAAAAAGAGAGAGAGDGVGIGDGIAFPPAPPRLVSVPLDDRTQTYRCRYLLWRRPQRFCASAIANRDVKLRLCAARQANEQEAVENEADEKPDVEAMTRLLRI